MSAGKVWRGEGSGRLRALQQRILLWSNSIVSDKCAAEQVSSLQAGQSPCSAASLGVQGGWERQGCAAAPALAWDLLRAAGTELFFFFLASQQVSVSRKPGCSSNKRFDPVLPGLAQRSHWEPCWEGRV